MVSRLFNFWRGQRRRLIGLLTLTSIILSVMPIRVSLPSPQEKDTSQPFPCQHRPCGCRSAEQCWKGCCCFTNSQKVAWAKSHRVQPPEYVVTAAEREKDECHSASSSCCSKKKPSTTASSSTLRGADATTGASCCSHKNDRARVNEVTERKRTSIVIGVFAQECQGHGWGWHSLPWSILPESPKPLTAVDPPRERTCTVSDLYPEMTLEPPVPPPRIFLIAFFAV